LTKIRFSHISAAVDLTYDTACYNQRKAIPVQQPGKTNALRV
jgi:hypothetical protein